MNYMKIWSHKLISVSYEERAAQSRKIGVFEVSQIFANNHRSLAAVNGSSYYLQVCKSCVGQDFNHVSSTNTEPPKGLVTTNEALTQKQ